MKSQALRPCVCAILVCVPLLCGPVAAKQPPKTRTIPTTSGEMLGVLNDRNVYVYRGIPFARPPVGDLRWRSPQGFDGQNPPPPQRLDLTDPSDGWCPQPAPYPLTGFVGSEDCLYLEIFTPRHQKKNKPVMVWIHGGGFVIESGTVRDASTLAGEGVIVVTVDYRLNALAALAHPELLGEDSRAANLALLDQIFALEWVRDNIAAFRGDPGNVTIFGQSAGGQSVCDLLASPLSEVLFHRAIIQSGACSLKTMQQAIGQAIEIAEVQLGCSPGKVPACLRSKPLAEIMEVVLAAGMAADWAPTVGDPVLPVDGFTSLANGWSHNVPLMVGSNADEGTLHLVLAYSTEDDLKLLLQSFYYILYPGAEVAIAQFYGLCGGGDCGCSVSPPPPPPPPPPPCEFSNLNVSGYPAERGFTPADEATIAIIGHINNCGSRLIAFSAQTWAPTYLYHFEHGPWSHPFTLYEMGAFHAGELSFLFPPGTPGVPFVLSTVTPEEQSLSDAIVALWASFAKNGAPVVHGLPAWPAYTLDFGAPGGLVEDYYAIGRNYDPATDPEHWLQHDVDLLKETCDFWFTTWGIWP